MKTLITPADVVALAFDATEALGHDTVSEAAILSAQHKFMRPALGGLYDELAAGMHGDLLAEYIKTPLALWVKWLILPSLAVSSSGMGVVQLHTGNFIPADPHTLSLARRRVKADARALMQCAVEHIASNPTLYASYSPSKAGNATGGIIM